MASPVAVAFAAQNKTSDSRCVWRFRCIGNASNRTNLDKEPVMKLTRKIQMAACAAALGAGLQFAPAAEAQVSFCFSYCMEQYNACVNAGVPRFECRRGRFACESACVAAGN
jgi:hypothetical protein